MRSRKPKPASEPTEDRRKVLTELLALSHVIGASPSGLRFGNFKAVHG